MSLAEEAIRLSRYPPETILEARILNLAGPGWNDLVTVRRITNLVRLEYVGQLRSGTVTLVRCEALQAGRRVIIDGPSNSFPNLDWSKEVPIFADDQLYVRYYATAGLANYQARAAYTAMPYSIAHKLALGKPLMALTAKERAIVEKYQLVNKVRLGQLPMEYPRGELAYTGYGAFDGTVPQAETTIFEVTPPEGYYAVLRRIWASRPAGSFNQLFMSVYHDDDLWYTIFPYCLPNHPTVTQMAYVELWSAGLKRLRLSVTSTLGGGHAGQDILAEYEIRRLTIWDKIGWYTRDGTRLLDDTDYASNEERALVGKYLLDEKYLAGIYEPSTAIPAV